MFVAIFTDVPLQRVGLGICSNSSIHLGWTAEVTSPGGGRHVFFYLTQRTLAVGK